MATFTELAADNPNIRQQYDDWREQRSANGEDPTDYQAFRQHLMAIGAPDPGESEIDDFVGDDFKAANPDRYPGWTSGEDLSSANPDRYAGRSDG